MNCRSLTARLVFFIVYLRFIMKLCLEKVKQNNSFILKRNFVNMDQRKTFNRDYVLESLRLDYTELTQDEFIVMCKLSRATYQRWVREKKPPRLTPEQITNICRICHISFNTFFSKLGLDISDIPKK